MGREGVEPSRLSAPELEPGVSASSTTSPCPATYHTFQPKPQSLAPATRSRRRSDEGYRRRSGGCDTGGRERKVDLRALPPVARARNLEPIRGPRSSSVPYTVSVTSTSSMVPSPSRSMAVVVVSWTMSGTPSPSTSMAVVEVSVTLTPSRRAEVEGRGRGPKNLAPTPDSDTAKVHTAHTVRIHTAHTARVRQTSRVRPNRCIPLRHDVGSQYATRKALGWRGF